MDGSSQRKTFLNGKNGTGNEINDPWLEFIKIEQQNKITIYGNNQKRGKITPHKKKHKIFFGTRFKLNEFPLKIRPLNLLIVTVFKIGK